MTANLQNENGHQRGPFYFSLNSVEAHFEPPARNSQRPPRAFRAPHETANAPPPRILRLRRKTAPKMKNRSRDPHHAPKGVADFAARRRQIILIINRRDMRVAIYSSRAAVTVVALRFPRSFGRANRASSSKPARFIRHRRRFADFRARLRRVRCSGALPPQKKRTAFRYS